MVRGDFRLKAAYLLAHRRFDRYQQDSALSLQKWCRAKTILRLDGRSSESSFGRARAWQHLCYKLNDGRTSAKARAFVLRAVDGSSTLSHAILCLSTVDCLCSLEKFTSRHRDWASQFSSCAVCCFYQRY